jgi:hypothetical protein
MERVFTVKLTDNDNDSILNAYANAENNQNFIFELKYNFFRKWKHAEKDPTLDEVTEAFEELMNDFHISVY